MGHHYDWGQRWSGVELWRLSYTSFTHTQAYFYIEMVLTRKKTVDNWEYHRRCKFSFGLQRRVGERNRKDGTKAWDQYRPNPFTRGDNKSPPGSFLPLRSMAMSAVGYFISSQTSWIWTPFSFSRSQTLILQWAGSKVWSCWSCYWSWWWLRRPYSEASLSRTPVSSSCSYKVQKELNKV